MFVCAHVSVCVWILPKCLISKLHAIKIQSIPPLLLNLMQSVASCAQTQKAHYVIWQAQNEDAKEESTINSRLLCCSVIGSFHIFTCYRKRHWSHALMPCSISWLMNLVVHNVECSLPVYPHRCKPMKQISPQRNLQSPHPHSHSLFPLWSALLHVFFFSPSWKLLLQL